MTTSVEFQLLTFVFTIIGGITIFIISQAVLKLVIEPVQQLKSAIGLTANTLLRYQAEITNARENSEISVSLKAHAAELVSKAAVISRYRWAAFVFGLPSRSDVAKAAQELNYIGYGLMDGAQAQEYGEQLAPQARRGMTSINHSKALVEIERLLRVATTYKD